jgi:hypothetical protein
LDIGWYWCHAAIVLLFIWSAVRRADTQGVTVATSALALFALVVPATLMYYGNIDQMDSHVAH